MRLDWFKFYPSDFLNSPDVMMMPPSARGCYITLLGRCWLNAKNGGGIPNKTDYILSVCNCTDKEWSAVKEAVLAKFEKRDGQLFNPRIMEEMLEVQDLSETKRGNAQSGWETRRIATALQPHSDRNRDALHIDKKREDVEKEIDDNECDFRNISRAYRNRFKKPSGKDKNLKRQYSDVCGKYGEEIVLAAFDEWAEANQWKNNKPGLFFFFKDAPEIIEEIEEVHKMEKSAKAETAESDSAAQAAILLGREAGRQEFERRHAEVETENESTKELPIDQF